MASCIQELHVTDVTTKDITKDNVHALRKSKDQQISKVVMTTTKIKAPGMEQVPVRQIEMEVQTMEAIATTTPQIDPQLHLACDQSWWQGMLMQVQETALMGYHVPKLKQQ